MGYFRKRERRLDEISEELLESDGGMDARLREIEDFVLGRMKDLNGAARRRNPQSKGRGATDADSIPA
jgi:hypothetical protein